MKDISDIHGQLENNDHLLIMLLAYCQQQNKWNKKFLEVWKLVQTTFQLYETNGQMEEIKLKYNNNKEVFKVNLLQDDTMDGLHRKDFKSV